MRGEFDDRLKWPFRGDITIQLLNQERDEGHVVRAIQFDDHTLGMYANRVTRRERNMHG